MIEITPNFKVKTIRCKFHTLQAIPSFVCCFQGRHVQKVKKMHASFGVNVYGCFGSVVAAHIRLGCLAGKGKKPGDNRTIPLCWAHHGLEGAKGELWFHGQYLNEAIQLGLDLYNLTLSLQAEEIDSTARMTDGNNLIKTFMLDVNRISAVKLF